MGKSLFIKSIVIGSLLGITLFGIFKPQVIKADSDEGLKFCRVIRDSKEVVRTIKMMVTAYSSSPEETDDTPFITASGKTVRNGIIANNLLPFGTKVRIPELYGDKIFVVEDRMHTRKGKYHADIWMAEKSEAIYFGAKMLEIEVLES